MKTDGELIFMCPQYMCTISYLVNFVSKTMNIGQIRVLCMLVDQFVWFPILVQSWWPEVINSGIRYDF